MDAEEFRQVRDAVRQLVREVVVPLSYRDARLYRLHEGTSEVQRAIIGGGLRRDAGMPRG